MAIIKINTLMILILAGNTFRYNFFVNIIFFMSHQKSNPGNIGPSKATLFKWIKNIYH